jgi:glucose/arabinose dehydrogenase
MSRNSRLYVGYKHWTPPTSPHGLAFSSDMIPGMYIGGMFLKQLYHNPDSGDRDGP